MIVISLLYTSHLCLSLYLCLYLYVSLSLCLSLSLFVSVSLCLSFWHAHPLLLSLVSFSIPHNGDLLQGDKYISTHFIYILMPTHIHICTCAYTRTRTVGARARAR